MAYQIEDIIGFTPTYLNEYHRKRVEECILSLKKQQQRPISREEALEQIRRNEELLATDPMYRQNR